MSMIDASLLPSRDELQDEVNSFRRNALVYTKAKDLPSDAAIPPSWVELLRRQDAAREVSVPLAWSRLENSVPRVLSFLHDNVCGLAVLVEPSNSCSLLYAYRQDGELNLFQGWPPCPEPRLPRHVAPVWSRVPKKLRDFYHQLHNGWIFLPSYAMGPLPLDRVKFLSDDEWSIERHEIAKLPFRLEAVLTFFGNGSGDYLCVDTDRAEEPGVVWWHEQPRRPDVHQDFWAVLDAWFSIFTEGAERVHR